jgi:transcriptional regulator with XRE-family HTH domain
MTAKPKPYLAAFAKTIQDAMKARNLTVVSLSDAMGLSKKERPAVYNWVMGKNGPGPGNRLKMAQALGLSAEQLIAPGKPGKQPGGRPPGTYPVRSEPARPVSGPAWRAVTLAETAHANGVQVMPPTPPVNDVFTIRARSDGSMAIRLDANLPFKRGMQLAQFLLSFGLVSSDDTEEAADGGNR